MKIRFKVDQANLFFRGMDVATSIVLLEVNPSTLPKNQYELIGRHLLNGDDGCDVVHDPERAKQSYEVVPIGARPGADLVEAKEPTLDSLLEELKALQLQAN
jgi:hypothetical protein